MQFATSDTGYSIKELYRLKSAQKMLELSGDANFQWSNPRLNGVEKDTISKYFALVGQEFWSMYSKAIKTWEKFAQTELNKAEKEVILFSAAEKKKLKSKATQKDVDAAEKKVKDLAESKSKSVASTIQAKFESMLPDLAKKAHEAVVKKLGNAAGNLKKNHGKAVLKAVVFTVAVAAVVLASIALGPLGGAALGIGIAAVAVKGLGVVTKGVKDLRSYIKEWNKVSEKAASEIDAASVAVDKALKAMDACHSVRESLQLKIAAQQNELDKINGGLDGADKTIAEMKKKLVKSKAELAELEKFIGDNTGDLLKHLQAANNSMTTVKAKKPRKFMSNLDVLMGFVDELGGLLT